MFAYIKFLYFPVLFCYAIFPCLNIFKEAYFLPGEGRGQLDFLIASMLNVACESGCCSKPFIDWEECNLLVLVTFYNAYLFVVLYALSIYGVTYACCTHIR